MIHVDSEAPLYADNGDLITDELWGIYFKRDRHGIQGGAAPIPVGPTFQVDPYPTEAMASAGFVVVGGTSVLMLNDGGELVLFAADGSECKELGRVQVCGTTWCNPAFSGGNLYLRDGIKTGGSWICVDLSR